MTPQGELYGLTDGLDLKYLVSNNTCMTLQGEVVVAIYTLNILRIVSNNTCMTLQGESNLPESRLDKASKGANTHNSYFHIRSTENVSQVRTSKPFPVKHTHNPTKL